MEPSCRDVGDTNPDIAGLGIVLAFAIQGGLSAILSVILSIDVRAPRLLERHFATLARILNTYLGVASSDQKQALIEKTLERMSDAQIIYGISLLIASFTQHDTLSLYHYRIIYHTATSGG
ncbi:hypothetical protein GGS23DRAFT_123469 [Durotheca rogersii]|uniref:uncharacterized protein n=1 Tax=Durotheca rogersii TaxID=419775 RepID=UPI00221FF5ED|nr:uncharacterized protein GGS23DRAFT_123469 [Durotheca rogersii]KAI5862031.1 hypothetical protein GGS23DRAFT_123469 [Durotheca rogersii]